MQSIVVAETIGLRQFTARRFITELFDSTHVHQNILPRFITARKRSLGKGSFYTGLSVTGVGCISACNGGVQPRADTPPPGKTPLPKMTTETDGTHPT